MGEIKLLEEISLDNINIDDIFWRKRINTNKEVTLEHQYEQLKRTGRIKNFKIAAEKIKGEFEGMFFNDSDVYKWIEAASHTLIQEYDQELEERLEDVVNLIADAQESNGYLNTYFTLVEPDKKWTNLGMMHELYCAGHLFEAAVAYYHAKDKKLLDVAIRLADHIDNTFRISGVKGVPGHEEIELGLISLYRVTDNEKYLKLAIFFVNNRGQSCSPLYKEIQSMEEKAGFNFHEKIENYDAFEVSKFYEAFFLNNDGKYDGKYAQDHLPVREHKTVEGHAVRAMYFYSAVTDIVSETNDKDLFDTLDILWNNMVHKRMYITGGIGSSHDNEGFTSDYDLPNEQAYAETCAAVGNILWNHRMLKLTGQAKYADIIEKVLYNGFLSGVSLQGDTFFYVNPLKSMGNHHRKGWFNVSCCPPNIARLLSSLGKYIYLQGDNEIFVNQYIGSQAGFKVANDTRVVLKQSNKYPWQGNVKLEIIPDKDANFTINLRLPEWSSRYNVKINGKSIDIKVNEDGYLAIKKKWSRNDLIELNIAMEVEKIYANPKVLGNVGKLALQRGPFIYCLEGIDNQDQDSLEQIIIPSNSKMETYFKEEILDGIIIISGEAVVPEEKFWNDRLYTNNNIQYKPIKFYAIPYHLWDHRESGEMLVWLKTDIS